MKAIIYTQKSLAEAALAYCTLQIDQGELTRVGTGVFSDSNELVPYTFILKHPSQSKWALVADDQVESLMTETAVELDSSWFPRSNWMEPQETGGN